MVEKYNNKKELIYLNDKNQRLMSYSSHIGIFYKTKYEMISLNNLMKAAAYGSQITVELANVLRNAEISEEWKKPVISILTRLKLGKLRIKGIETHIANDMWHGYIDIDCDKCFIELKTRGTVSKLDFETVIQAELYKRIYDKKYQIWYLNKKTNEITRFMPTRQQIAKSKKIINQTEKLWTITNN